MTMIINLPDGRKATAGKCKGTHCGATIFWATSPKSGKMSPYDADGTSHFKTCPDVAKFSGGK